MSFLVWWLALPSMGCGWPFLVRVGLALPSWSVVVGPSFLGCGGWPFLLGVWWLALPSWGSGWSCLFGVGVVPFLLEVIAGPPFSGPSVFLMLVFGPFFVGLGLAFPCWSGGWPFLLGVWVGLSIFGWELVLSLWCGGFSLPSWGVALLSSVVGPMPTLRERRARGQPPFQEGPTSTETKKGGPTPTTEDKRASTQEGRENPPHQRDKTNSHPKKDSPTPTPRRKGQLPLREGRANPKLKKEGPYTHSNKERKGQPPPRRTKGQHPKKEGSTTSVRKTEASPHPKKKRRKPKPQEGRANPNPKKEGPTTTLRRTCFPFFLFFFAFFFFFLCLFFSVFFFSFSFFFVFFSVFFFCVFFFFLFVFFSLCFFFLEQNKNVSFEDLKNFQIFNFQFSILVSHTKFENWILKIENLKVSLDQKKKTTTKKWKWPKNENDQKMKKWGKKKHELSKNAKWKKTKNVSFEDLENFQIFNFQFSIFNFQIWCHTPSLKIENWKLKIFQVQKKKDNKNHEKWKWPRDENDQKMKKN